MLKVISHVTAFLTMFAIMTLVSIVMIYLALIAAAFIIWHPLVFPSFWAVLRLAVIIGAFVGVWFASSNEGQAFAEGFRNGYND